MSAIHSRIVGTIQIKLGRGEEWWNVPVESELPSRLRGARDDAGYCDVMADVEQLRIELHELAESFSKRLSR